MLFHNSASVSFKLRPHNRRTVSAFSHSGVACMKSATTVS